MSWGSLETGSSWYSGSRLAPMTWELLVEGKRDSRATESYHLGTLICPLKLKRELGAKEPPQVVKLYFMNQDDLGFGGM